MKVHAINDGAEGGTACNSASNYAEVSPALSDVTCGHCVRIMGTVGVVRPVFPRYPSAEYCDGCGLSFSHWDGCLYEMPEGMRKTPLSVYARARIAGGHAPMAKVDESLLLPVVRS